MEFLPPRKSTRDGEKRDEEIRDEGGRLIHLLVDLVHSGRISSEKFARDGEELVGRSLKTTAIAMKRSSPGLLCSVRRERGSRRSWEACRGGEGRPVAAATASGGGDGARVCEGESRGRGGGRGRVRERSGWLRGVSGASRRGGERAGRQRGRWRGAVARARAGHAPIPLSGRKTTEGGQWAGPALAAGPARPHREEAQVSFSSFSVF